MAYGTLKCDNIVFDNGGVDKLITVSGLFYSTSGALTVTGAISGGSVTAPTATFTTLTGTTTAGTTATFTSGSFTSLTGVTTTVTSGIFGLGSAAAPSITISGYLNTGIYSPGANQLAITTSGTGRIIVDASGNVNIDSNTLYVDAVNNRVGVGTSAPVSALHIEAAAGSSQLSIGNTALAVIANDLVAGIDFFIKDNNDVTGATCGAVRAIASQTHTLASKGTELAFYTTLDGTSTLSERVRIDDAGRVGIGTLSPTTLLNLKVASDATLAAGVDGIRIDSSLSGANKPLALVRTGSSYFYNGVGASRNNLYSNGTLAIQADGGNIEFCSGGSLNATLDSSGRLLVGTSTSSNNIRLNQKLAVVSVGENNIGGISLTSYSGAAGADAPSVLDFQRSRGITDGTLTAVATGDSIGTLLFRGATGSAFANAASIQGLIDTGTVSASSMPGRLVFSTSADGAASPTERLRITNDGVRCYNQPTPATYAAAATLTVADLKTAIITYTGTAATLTLPTGTLTEGGFANIYTNMTFEWSVINTGAGICTIGGGTAHTIVGSGTIAIGASARFASRRTAANTFVSYRLS